MLGSFCTNLPFRHNRVFASKDGCPLSSGFKTRVAVRPARLVFQSHPNPRSEELAWWIRDHASTSDKKVGPPHSPFVYRGYVAALPEAAADVAVRLWEEPSGRPLEAVLPRDWFDDVPLHKGSPFRLVTWMEETDDELEPRHRIERLETAAPAVETKP